MQPAGSQEVDDGSSSRRCCNPPAGRSARVLRPALAANIQGSRSSSSSVLSPPPPAPPPAASPHKCSTELRRSGSTSDGGPAGWGWERSYWLTHYGVCDEGEGPSLRGSARVVLRNILPPTFPRPPLSSLSVPPPASCLHRALQAHVVRLGSGASERQAATRRL